MILEQSGSLPIMPVDDGVSEPVAGLINHVIRKVVPNAMNMVRDVLRIDVGPVFGFRLG